MNNFIINWWRSQQLKSALRRGDTQRAIIILQKIQKSGARFSWLEKLFRDKLQLERTTLEHKRETANLIKRLSDEQTAKTNLLLIPDDDFIQNVYKVLKYNNMMNINYRLQELINLYLIILKLV